jgi:outer membrane lipopolysaccharide assembly protein LptE/RlpB
MMLLAIGCLSVAGCGYHVVGRANTLPPDAKTIAIPAFGNQTTTYRIEQVLTESVVHEFIARTKYRVITDADDADLVLRGDVLNAGAGAVLFDPTTGVATTVVVTVTARFTLQDRNGKMLYQANNLVFREPYEIAEICPTPTQVCPATEANPNSFFQEEGPALDRMSRDFAEQVVSDILENF